MMGFWVLGFLLLTFFWTITVQSRTQPSGWSAQLCQLGILFPEGFKQKKEILVLTVASGLAGSRCSSDIIRLHLLYNELILDSFSWSKGFRNSASHPSRFKPRWKEYLSFSQHFQQEFHWFSLVHDYVTQSELITVARKRECPESPQMGPTPSKSYGLSIGKSNFTKEG